METYYQPLGQDQLTPAASVEEIQGLYGPLTIAESLIQKIWLKQNFLTLAIKYKSCAKRLNIVNDTYSLGKLITCAIWAVFSKDFCQIWPSVDNVITIYNKVLG